MKRNLTKGILALVVLILTTTSAVNAQKALQKTHRYHKFFVPGKGIETIKALKAYYFASVAPPQNAWFVFTKTDSIFVKANRDIDKADLFIQLNNLHDSGVIGYDRPCLNDEDLLYYLNKAVMLEPSKIIGQCINTGWSDTFGVVELKPLDLTNPLNSCVCVGKVPFKKGLCGNNIHPVISSLPKSDKTAQTKAKIKVKGPIIVMDNCEGAITMEWYTIKDNGDTTGVWSKDNLYYYDFRDGSWFKKIGDQPYVQICLPDSDEEVAKARDKNRIVIPKNEEGINSDLISNPPPAPKKVKFWQFKMKRLARTPKNKENDSGDNSSEE